MKKQSSSSSGFILELIAAVGIFALASAVCVQLFVHAHFTAEDSRALSGAVRISQSTAEAFKATNGDMDKMLEVTNAYLLGGELVIAFDDRFIPSQPLGTPRYMLTMVIRDEGDKVTGNIRIRDLKEVTSIYFLDVATLK